MYGRLVVVMKNIYYYVPGMVLLLLAVIIMAVPQIMVAFVSAALILAGIAGLMIGHGMRKADHEMENYRGFMFGDDFFGRPFFKGWYFRR